MLSDIISNNYDEMEVVVYEKGSYIVVDRSCGISLY